MTMLGVLRPGFVQLRVLDMEASIRHYRDMLGMTEVGRGDDGRVYFKAYSEFDRHSVVLREADEAGMDVLGFKVASPEVLAGFRSKLRAYGVETEDIPAGEQVGVGERVRFKAPTGHIFDLYAHMDRSEHGPMTYNPDVWVSPPRGMGVIRFDHCLLYGRDIDGVTAIFRDVLGFQLAEELRDEKEDLRMASFLTCSTKAHDIAFVRHKDDGKFHHCSFLLEDWAAIGHAADLMSRYNVNVEIGPTRHGITQGKTIYFWDPSGNRNEVFAGGYAVYPDYPTRVWSTDEFGKAIFYYEKELVDSFLDAVT